METTRQERYEAEIAAAVAEQVITESDGVYKIEHIPSYIDCPACVIYMDEVDGDYVGSARARTRFPTGEGRCTWLHGPTGVKGNAETMEEAIAKVKKCDALYRQMLTIG